MGEQMRAVLTRFHINSRLRIPGLATAFNMHVLNNCHRVQKPRYWVGRLGTFDFAKCRLPGPGDAPSRSPSRTCI